MFQEHILRRCRRVIRRLYASFLNSRMQSYWEEIEHCKKKVFDKLSGTTEKVLEIGIGTGPNMKYYVSHNQNITVYGLDPNLKTKKYARRSAEKAGLKPKKFRFKQGVGEAIPLDDASMDAVVATLVLCSVSDVTQTLKEICSRNLSATINKYVQRHVSTTCCSQQTNVNLAAVVHCYLRDKQTNKPDRYTNRNQSTYMIGIVCSEIKRVLKPGGIFIFVEHVAAQDGSLFRRLQEVLNPLQQRLADGCHLTRDTRKCILEAGFNGGTEIETMSMYSFPWITRPHVYGVAYK